MLSDELWARQLEPPVDERELARLYTVGPDDLAQVMLRRSDANRRGFALVLLYLRYPGRALAAKEAPPAPVVAYVARQLGAPATALADYARRDLTRRTHLAELAGPVTYGSSTGQRGMRR